MKPLYNGMLPPSMIRRLADLWPRRSTSLLNMAAVPRPPSLAVAQPNDSQRPRDMELNSCARHPQEPPMDRRDIGAPRASKPPIRRR